MNKLKYVVLLSLINLAFADTYISQNESGVTVLSNKPASGASKYTVDQNAKDISAQIQQINNSINSTSQQKVQLDQAISASQAAINKTQQLIKNLQKNREIKEAKLAELQQQIPLMTTSVEAIRFQVNKNINQIYQKINQINSNSKDSLFTGNDTLESNRQKVYMTQLLNLQLSKYKELNTKLDTLQKLNVSLDNELKRIDAQLKQANASEVKYKSVINDNQAKSSKLDSQLSSDKQKLSNLKAKQAELNKLLEQIRQQEIQASKARKLAAEQASKNNKPSGGSCANNSTGSSSGTKQINPFAIDTSYDDNSPFMSRNLVRPVEGKILIGFGDKREGVRNNGVLVGNINNAPVRSLSTGTVMFSGSLPGFGQLVVIDNGDNYTSVYSGIVIKANKGDHVQPGQVIGSTGTAANQPMGGVYFELRHFGKPVNPSTLFK